MGSNFGFSDFLVLVILGGVIFFLYLGFKMITFTIVVPDLLKKIIEKQSVMISLLKEIRSNTRTGKQDNSMEKVSPDSKKYVDRKRASTPHQIEKIVYRCPVKP